ncbi:PI3kinase-like protein [Gonium pectorale]|uniref:PI3kinase-like protein n=1 Tax=Gonium pectorale TaxID=33097 RepID=A0A150GHQ0_GONPE|nr:PI3kinase-like protein [Gonium pectorale]|eukprot:KXZ49313.1 PI3kinase-like protein [Gonium pectorale]
MRFVASTCGAWLPPWQDDLAVAPQQRALRSQQLARLLELLFQATAAQQGGLLLRKRAPSAPAGSAGQGEDVEAVGRMEALQRLALGLTPVSASASASQQPDGESGAAGAAVAAAGAPAAGSATAEGAGAAVERSGAALVWLVVQEGAKQAVAARLRTHLGGPTQTLGALERMLQVCEEWFARVRELLARTALLTSAHHHAIHNGLLRLQDLRNTMRQLLANLAAERKAAATGPVGRAAPSDAPGTGGGPDAPRGSAAASGGLRSGSGAQDAAPSEGMPGRHGSKHLQRRGGQLHQAQGGTAAPAAASGGADAGAATAPQVPVLQQLEGNLARLALAVVDLAKLVGVAMLAAGEADNLQGLHAWVLCEFEPLLAGVHLPGASAVAAASASAAAAAAAAAADAALASSPSARAGAAGGGARRRTEVTRNTRSTSKSHKDAFAWLQGLSQQAAGAYEQALLTYNAFLASPRSPSSSSASPGPNEGRLAGGAPGAAFSSPAAQEMAAVAQGFVVERVAECYAALSDWAGLQGLMDAYSRSATAEPAVASWWHSAAASMERRFRSYAAFDAAESPAQALQIPSEEPVHASSDCTPVMLASMRALRSASLTDGSAPSPSPHAGAAAALRPLRDAVATELSRTTDRLRACSLSDPASQREVLLQACSLSAAARGLDAASGRSRVGPDGAAGSWLGLLDARSRRDGSGYSIGAALLSPDGSIQAGSVRDVAITGALLRVARSADPRVGLPGTRALSCEHIRAAVASGNWTLATRHLQMQSALWAPPDAPRAVAASFPGGAGAAGGSGAGVRAVLAVAHSLLSAAAARLPPAQVVDLQLRALLPHLEPQPQLPALLQEAMHLSVGQQLSGVDAEDVACALCTMGRWMMRASATHAAHASQQRPTPAAVAQQTQPTPAQWVTAADWRSLAQRLLSSLATAQSHAHVPPVPRPGANGLTTGAAASAGSGATFAVPEAILQGYHAPAVCALRAIQLSRGSARAWKAWADLLFRATKEHRARAARPPASPESVAADVGSSAAEAARQAAAGYGAAAAAYCRYLALSSQAGDIGRSDETLHVLLQLLQIVVRHSSAIEPLLTEQLPTVPPLVWAAVAPQLLAQLPGASGAARRLLGAALAAVGRAAPSLVLYPIVVEVRAADSAAASAAATASSGAADGSAAAATAALAVDAVVPELRALLSELGRSRPGLLAGMELLVGEMERLTVLVDERWAALLTEVEVEIARRAVSLQAEAARVEEDASLTAEQRQALLASRYTTLMSPAVLLLERQLRSGLASGSQEAETPHERRFAQAVLPRLRAATAALRDGSGVRDWARPAPAWAPLRAASATLARRLRQPLPPLAELSPVLAALAGSEIPMPGCNDGACDGGAAAAAAASGVAGGAAVVTVVGVESEVVAMSTKTRPKRVTLRGSDGAAYVYLIKGREDLRMDERLMQSDPAAACRDLPSIRHYSVTPLGPRAGLIQWVPATTSLFAVFRSWQVATLERHAAMVAARQEGTARAAVEGVAPPPEVEPPPAIAVSRPIDFFYANLVPALQERGLSSATPRREWPHDVLRAVLANLASAAPCSLLARVLWAGGGSAASSWRRQQHYGRSLAVMSCVGHLLGLGDRHPDNILLEGREAGVVHIDYNVCWEKGTKLRVPEVVPFRLTQMLVSALGVGGLEGPFRAACEATLACLRRRREAIASLVEAVLSDPGVDWAVEREDVAARQDMELAVALNLFVSRAEEVQQQLAGAEDMLPVVMEGPAAALLAYAESHSFAEALRGVAAEAASRGQQAKGAMEAASRTEAEARAIVAAATQEAASLAAEGSALCAALPQLLQQCAAWAQQHGGTLSVLREGSFLEGTLGSAASWHAVESGAAFGLLAPVPGPGPLSLSAAAPVALLPAILGGNSSVIAQLPEELLATCRECDQQVQELLARREAALGSAVSALTQFGTVARKLLPPSYPASSYHHRWAQALSALAAGGLVLPAVMQAQALAPREPRPADVATLWQALRGAHRLAAAATAVLAPGSPEAGAEGWPPVGHDGQAAGARVLGRELANAVSGALRAFAESNAVVAHPTGGGEAAAQAELAVSLTHALRQQLLCSQQQQQPGDGRRSEGANATLVAAVRAFRKVVLSAHGRLPAASPAGSAPGPVSGPAAAVARIAQLRGDVASIAAVSTAFTKAGLAETVFGTSAKPPAFPGDGGGAQGPCGRAGSPGLFGVGQGAGPLPWLDTAAGALAHWVGALQRLAVDVAPEIAGQLHIGSGAGGPMLPRSLPEAAVDLRALLGPVEEALQAGRDCHSRMAALAELTATYHSRAAHLTSLLSGGAPGGLANGQPPMANNDLAALEAELQALDAAWLSRESTAAGLAAAAARTTEGLTEALRRLYAVVLGPVRLPLELQPPTGAAAAALAAAVGGDVWAEAGVGGHAAVAAVAAFWESTTAELEVLRHRGGGNGGDEEGALAPAPSPASAGSVEWHELPTGMRPLWRCVEMARLLARSLESCLAVRLLAPAGTDGSLAEAYGAVLPLLARLVSEHALSLLEPGLRQHLGALAAQLAAVEQQGDQSQVQVQRAGPHVGAADSAVARGADGSAAALAAAPELVPFTDFDPQLPGEGESLGGLEGTDGEEAEAGGGSDDEGRASALGDAFDGDADGELGADGEGEEEEDFDLDLGLDLDLDDGFEASEQEPDRLDESSSAAGSSRGSAAAAAAAAPAWTPSELADLVERLASAAAGASLAAASASIHPAAAAAAAAAAVASARAPRPAASAAVTWVAGPEARAFRASRLQLLASYEWLHEHHLLQALPAGDPRIGQGVAQFFASQPPDPLQPSARTTAPSRLALLSALQAALDELPGLEAALSGWEAASGSAVGQLVAMLRGTPEQFPVDTALAAQRAGGLVGRRQQWLAESRGVAMRVCQVAEALLQFEYSRQGITWATGGAVAADGFAAHYQLLGRAEVLATLSAGGSEAARGAAVAEASSRAAAACRQAAEARQALEAAQYEEAAANSQLAAHWPLLVSRALDLPVALAELEPAVRALAQLLEGKLGPALKELSSVSAQHDAAADVASVASAVASHHERCSRVVSALAEAVPSTATALAAVDASAPLPADMATEVGFLSAQLVGGAAAAAVARERAQALLQHLSAAVSALQPVVHVIAELPRGVSQLRGDLATLASAAASIAAAVQSKHVLPALEDERPHQPPPRGQPSPVEPASGGEAAAPLGDRPKAQSAAGAAGTPCTTADGARGGELPGSDAGGALEGRTQASVGAAVPVAPAPSAGPQPSAVHQSRRSAADEARRRAFASTALRRFIAKLEGREGEGAGRPEGPPSGGHAAAAVPQLSPQLSVSGQVDVLIRQATSVDRLAQMYEGWAAWL